MTPHDRLERVVIDGAEYVRAYPVAHDRCPHCGGKTARWTAGRIVAAIREHVARFGVAPTVAAWERVSDEHPSARTAQDMFGGWTTALRVADADPASRYGQLFWTRERIIEALREHGAHNEGKPPRARDWMRSGPDHPSHRTVWGRFGSWNAALDAAGFYPRGPYGVHLRPKMAKTPEPIGRVNAEPVAELLRRELLSRSSQLIADELAVDSTYIQKIANGSLRLIRADYADRILTMLDRPDLLEAPLSPTRGMSASVV